MTSIFYNEFLSTLDKKKKKFVNSTNYVSLEGLRFLKDNTPTVVANCDFIDGSIGLTWKQFPNTSWEDFQSSPANFLEVSKSIVNERMLNEKTIKTEAGMVFYWLTNCEQIFLLAKMLDAPLCSNQEEEFFKELMSRRVEVVVLPVGLTSSSFPLLNLG